MADDLCQNSPSTSDLDTLYHAGSVDISELYAAVDSFFLDCNHLADWFIADSQSEYALPAKVRSKVSGYRDRNKDLLTARGYANTSKHYKRKKAGQLTARISGWKPEGQNGCKVTVFIGSHSGAALFEEDAFGLARRCMVAWHDFLEANKVDIPLL